jgi:hypothetical protein
MSSYGDMSFSGPWGLTLVTIPQLPSPCLPEVPLLLLLLFVNVDVIYGLDGSMIFLKVNFEMFFLKYVEIQYSLQTQNFFVAKNWCKIPIMF